MPHCYGLPEEFPSRPGYYALVLVGLHAKMVVLVLVAAQHCVGLPTAGLTVGHDANVVPAGDMI